MSFLERQLEDPLRLARIKRYFYIGLAVIALFEAVVILAPLFITADPDAKHAHFWFEQIPAWGSIYGLFSCIVIIVVSKFIGKKWLMRQEDYYDA